MPTGSKSKTAVAGRDRTNDSTSLLDARNGLYKYKPYKPEPNDFKYREYKYKPYKPQYEDPLTKKLEIYPYKPYVSEVGYNRYFDYQLPKQNDLSFRKEKPTVQESHKEKSLKKSQPKTQPPVVVTNNNTYNDMTDLKGFRYEPFYSKASVFQYHRFQPPLDW